MKEPDISIPGWLLLVGANTLQERAFSRLVLGAHKNRITFVTHPQESFEIAPIEPTTRSVMEACCTNRWSYKILSELPFLLEPRSAFSDAELNHWLQDLAMLIAYEASEAFTASIYPGVPDVFVDPDHVKIVMLAMQREMNRESQSRRKVPTVFTDLPWERQVALAERRRYWYGQFGITPEVWATGKFSLWHVAKFLPDILI